MASQSAYANCEAVLCEDHDARMIFVTNGAWFRFEGCKLGQTIYTFLDNPDSAAMPVYQPFLKLLQTMQESKDTGESHHRTVSASTQRRTALPLQNERERIACYSARDIRSRWVRYV
jgi:hypothetical protein